MANKQNGYYSLRWQILARDHFTCQYCGQKAPDVKLEVDHMLSIMDGGTDNSDNLVTSCYACNRGKSSLSITVDSEPGDSAKWWQKSRRGKVFAFITERGSVSTRDIVTYFDIGRNNASQITKRLREQGLIEKVDNQWKVTVT